MDKGLQLPPALKPPETWLVSAELRQGRCLDYKPSTVATSGASWNGGHSFDPVTWPVEKGLPVACQGVSVKPQDGTQPH